MKGSLSILFLLASVMPAQAERVWLVIGASDVLPAEIAHKAKEMPREGLIIRTADCGDGKNIFVWAATVEASAEAARARLSKIIATVPDAYVRSCDVKHGSLLAYRIPAVDPSIADVPDTAVNWESKDRISTVKTLSGGMSFVISRYYEKAADDPLEGRRERVILVDSRRKKHVLVNNCTNASNAKTMGEYVVFECATEQAGNYLMHKVLLFDKEGRKVRELQRCRNPFFTESDCLSCETESVKADGTLSLRKLKYHLSK